MLVFAPVPAYTAPHFRPTPLSAAYPNTDYLDAVAEQAAQDYVLATARLQAVERQREKAQQQRYLQEVNRSQAVLDQYYRQQSRHETHPLYSTTLAPIRRSPAYATETLAYSVRGEEERRRILLIRQREAQRARALAEARQRQEADLRLRARVEAQRLREANPILALMDFSAPTPTQAVRPQQQSRAPTYHRCPPTCAAQPSTSQSKPRADSVDEDSLYAALQEYLTQLTTSDVPARSADRKGKGKAVDVQPEPTPVAAPASVPQQPEYVPSFKEELESRMRTETDSEIQAALVKLYSDIFDVQQLPEAQFVAGPSRPQRERHFANPASAGSPPAQSQPTSPDPASSGTAPSEGVKLHRTPAIPPAVAERLLKFYHARRARKLSLAQITSVEDALRKLESTFEFPPHLDFVNPVPADAPSVAENSTDSDEPGPLAYTPNNSPVHAYEHALSELLTQLDAVESNGDLSVRGRRKEVVREVERALEEIERRVEESRERERERSRERRRSAASSPAPSASTSDEEETPTKEEMKSESFVEAITPVSVLDITAPTVAGPDAPFIAGTAGIALVDVASASTDQDAAEVSSTELAPSAPAENPSTSTDESSIMISASLTPALTEASVADCNNIALVDTLPVPVAVEAEDSQNITSVDVSDLVSPIAPSELSDATFITAPSTLPPTSVPTPEAVTRSTSSTTEATFVTADVDSASSSPMDAAPEAMTRTPSEAPSESTAEETFLLSSTPLADAPKRARQQETREDPDELQVISKEEVEADAHAAKSDSEWSDVDAA
ncbi:hypothetical protein BC628DRAFT_1474239 [Trametes gibbosa]|nr:hypothetical protein BC628DRAFT_1474239 [Trametes gibbosa]